MSEPDFLADYLALRAANDQLRERGQQWLFDSLNQLCAEANRELGAQPDQPMIQLGRQTWEFKVEQSVMIGEAMALRFRLGTLLTEVGWPRLPEHGHVPGQGLARARIGLSPSPMIEAQLFEELILKQQPDNNPAWQTIKGLQLGDVLTETHLRAFLQRLLEN